MTGKFQLEIMPMYAKLLMAAFLYCAEVSALY
jgi:hypothetical protein